MAKAGTCKTGFISAPSRAPNGKILSKGLDVNSKNSKKPKIIKLNINKVNFFKGWLLSSEFMNRMLQAVKNTIQRNIEPSCALHIEVTL